VSEPPPTPPRYLSRRAKPCVTIRNFFIAVRPCTALADLTPALARVEQGGLDLREVRDEANAASKGVQHLLQEVDLPVAPKRRCVY
jgi:hypothetical protein